MKHRSKAHLSKQLATKRDVQRARDDILHAIVKSAPPREEPGPLLVQEFAPFERIERAVNG